jgi:hypothetical protein
MVHPIDTPIPYSYEWISFWRLDLVGEGSRKMQLIDILLF